MEYVHLMRIKVVVCVYRIRLLCPLKTIHQKTSCYDGDIYCSFSLNFLYYIYTKVSVSPHVHILGTNYCGNTFRESFKRYRANQYVCCFHDYSERVVDIFAHQMQSE